MKKVFLFLFIFIAANIYSQTLLWDQETKKGIENFTIDEVKALIALGANVDERNSNAQTPLQIAAGCREYSIVKLLLDNGANINARDELGNSPILAAASGTNDPRVIELLATSGAILNDKSKFNVSVLSSAVCFNKNVLITKAIIELDYPLYEENDLLISACIFAKNPEIIELLLEYGFDPKCVDRNGLKPVDYAKKNPLLYKTSIYYKLLDISY